MRLRRRPQVPDGENVLPLINVVFLLLVFFMVAGALERADLFTVKPPEAATAAEGSAGAGLLLLAADGRLALDGQALDRADLPAAVARLDGAPLTLKADAGAEALAVVALLEELRAAGVETVTLLATGADQ